MATLVWDSQEDRVYEFGIDRGVLYLPDGSAVPWNGLISVSQEPGRESEDTYLNGLKTGNVIQLLPLKGSVVAFTYPEELELDSLVAPGGHAANQARSSFGLSYREKISDGGYKITILGNLQFTPNTKTYTTITDKPTILDFQWTIEAPRVGLPGVPPTARLVIDTSIVDSDFLTELEEILYGSISQDAGFTNFTDFLEWVYNWFKLQIIDNGDGSWTASTIYPGYIVDLGANKFRIDNADADYIDGLSTIYEIGDT